MIACLLVTSSLIISTVQGVANGLPLPVAQLKDAHGNTTSKTIDVFWTDAPSIIGKLESVIYEIEVYNPGQKEAVHRASVEKRPNLTVTHDWHWTSPLPLECLSHSVRLRVRHKNNVSDWTDRRNVTGSGSDHSKLALYPVDDVGLAGSKKKFCCVVPEGKTVPNFTYNDVQSMNYTHVSQTYIFEVTLEQSDTGGEHVSCKEKDGANTAMVFVGYSPEVHNFTCETRNLRHLECSWTQGRDKNLRGVRGTKYTLNERSCGTDRSLHKCSIEISPNQGEVAWTLTAENKINKTSFTYTADPRHRVYLESPQHLRASGINSRNASLQWEQWPDAYLVALPMRCQAKKNSEREVREDDTGVGLISMTLRELHPYTTYSVQVRCASNKHFWKWGDWSKEIIFETKEDIPQAVDVWMTVDSNNRSLVVWKLVPEKSHGKLVKYELSWNGSVPLRLEPTQHCYSMSTDRVKRITITAMNSVGYSQPSTIISPSQARDVETTRVNGGNGGVELAWAPMPGASCGYVVDWYPVGSQDKCDIQWIKIPAGRTNTTINSGFKNGVRYTFSLYACTTHAPELLKRWEGYRRELAPDQKLNFQVQQEGMDVVLTWDEIPLEHRRGFIQNYTINYSTSSYNNMGQQKIFLGSKERMKLFSNLRAETYNFQMSAFTSAGEGPPRVILFTLMPQTHQTIIRSIISLGFVFIIAIVFSILCYRKRTWLKEMLYPDIPGPQLDYPTSKEIHDFQLLAIPAENVDNFLTCELDAEDGVISAPATPVTDSDYLPNYIFPDHNIGSSSLSSPNLVLDNPTYNLLVAFPVSPCATPVTTVAATGGYNPQGSPAFCPLPPCSESYQALEDVC
ncbi:leukemia inhibitory factor receptor-like isoform X2 [Alosa alosa]|uniref:leukemia inhibitory factor receptor-like isoform X2 n=1 Tax=Alosa alosa TaxID=278164 RepID=UPI0020150CD8|nr:leukemia inhibitory factor receptor-like isoform X2 [Alosa alosa]